MTPGELAAVRGRLEEFAAEMFAPLARRDQRDKGATYVRGLLLDGRRKSMQPMAERLGVDHQGLQQFVSSSTWAVEPVRERLARRAVEVIAAEAWVVDDTGFPKDGTASPGVARQYSGTLGKVGNCQVGVSVCAVTDAASCPLDWRLFLPERWDDAGVASPEAAAAVAERRARAGIPAEARHREKWPLGRGIGTKLGRLGLGPPGAGIPAEAGHREKGGLALDMVDELAGWGLAPPVVVADAGYGDIAEFRDGLGARGRPWVVQVQGVLSAHAEGAVPALVPTSGRGRPSRPRYRTKPVALRAHVLAAGRAAARQVTWRQGSRGPMSSHFVVLRVRPAGHHQAARGAADGSLPAVWRWPSGRPRPPSPPTTGSPPCPRTRRWPSWSGWPRSAGGSNTTTASSRPPSAWTTSRAAPGPAGTGTSPWSPPPNCSSPCCGPAQKRLRRPEPLRGPARTADPPGHLDRHLFGLRTPRRRPRPGTDLTKHY